MRKLLIFFLLLTLVVTTLGCQPETIKDLTIYSGQSYKVIVIPRANEDLKQIIYVIESSNRTEDALERVERLFEIIVNYHNDKTETFHIFLDIDGGISLLEIETQESYTMTEEQYQTLQELMDKYFK